MQEAQHLRKPWPALNYTGWRDTLQTLHLWTQIVGKVRLTLSPWLNHGWQVPLYVTARGLGTTAIHAAGGLLEIEFDFIDHRLVVRNSQGPERGFALHPAWLRAVLAGHERVAHGLRLDIPVFTMLSARSLIAPVWSDAMLSADTVLDVDGVARRAADLGSLVTVARFEGALHDILLSARAVRADAYAAMARWLRYALNDDPRSYPSRG